MNGNSAITRDQLRAHYLCTKSEHEKRQEFFVWAIYRPLSFYATPVFLRTGISANQVSLLGIALSLALPGVAWVAPERGYIAVALLSLLCLVLDCVDGNIAPANGTTSKRGQYLDSLAGKIHYLMLVGALAVMAHRELPALDLGYWLCLALGAALLHLWGRESRAYFKLHLADSPASLAAGSFGFRHVLLGLPDLAPAAVLLLGSVGLTYLALLGALGLEAGFFLATQLHIFSRL
jgi:phosphatidylglycerophosphate synthase